MSKKRTKRKSKKKGPKGGTQRTVHYMLHAKDVKAWGSRTMCGKTPKAGTSDPTKVSCKQCMRRTNWNIEQYKRACADPLVLCCDKDKCDCLFNAF